MADYSEPKYVEERVRFYDGQFLKDNDFIVEQKYHVNRQCNLARALTVFGICEGLTVDIGDVKEHVTIQPGMAIDEQGRQVVLAQKKDIAIGKEYGGQTVHVVISYMREAADPDGGTTTKDGSDTTDIAESGREGFRRWHENSTIELVKGDDANLANKIVLASLMIDRQTGIVSEKGGENTRIYSGLSLPVGNGDALTLRSEMQGGKARIALEGDLGIAGALAVSKEATSEGGLYVYDTGKVGVGTTAETADHPLTIHGKSGGGKVDGSEITSAGTLALRSDQPQIDFIDTADKDWAIHVNSNKMYFISEPWNHKGLVLYEEGKVGIGTDATTPTAKLQITGDEDGDKNIQSALQVTGGITFDGRLQITGDEDEHKNIKTALQVTGGITFDGSKIPTQTHPLTIHGKSGGGKVDGSEITSAGTLALRSDQPQIDFIDTADKDWAIHVNSNKMYFISEPWNHKGLVLYEEGKVGIGTDATTPTEQLHVVGNVNIGGKIFSNSNVQTRILEKTVSADVQSFSLLDGSSITLKSGGNYMILANIINPLQSIFHYAIYFNGDNKPENYHHRREENGMMKPYSSNVFFMSSGAKAFHTIRIEISHSLSGRWIVNARGILEDPRENESANLQFINSCAFWSNHQAESIHEIEISTDLIAGEKGLGKGSSFTLYGDK